MNTPSKTNAAAEAPRSDAPARQRTCASCRNWDVRIARTNALRDSVARCLLPPMAELHLVVSGSGGCDRWEPMPPD